MKVLNSYRKGECMEFSRLILESGKMHSFFVVLHGRNGIYTLFAKNANDLQKC